ncbi:MAG: acyltransferase [Desulfobacteraceae bacterium]|nr:acyltransferase [Desulfobacteraceae bacterium]
MMITNSFTLDSGKRPLNMNLTMHNKEYIQGMHGLRALAALFVFAVHYNQMTGLDFTAGPFDIAILMANGEHGVSLFFSLSGFLLSLPLWKACINGHPYPVFKTYFIRRTARIIPAYFFVLSALILLSSLWKMPGAWFDIIAHYLFVFNFTEFTIFSICPPFWTIAVEVQFYIMLPLLFIGLRWFQIKQKVGLVIGLLILSACAAQYVILQTADTIIPWPFSPWLNWIRPHGAVLNHSLIANLPHFLLGIYGGYFFMGLRSDSRSYRFLCRHGETIFWSASSTIFILLSTDWINSFSFSFSPYGLPVIPVLLVIIIISTPLTRLALKILESPILKNLGILSYGFYLFHHPCLFYLEYYLRQKDVDIEIHWLAFGSAGLLLTLVMAVLSYFLIEKPFLRLVRRK